jgi:hypothetical protein
MMKAPSLPLVVVLLALKCSSCHGFSQPRNPRLSPCRHSARLFAADKKENTEGAPKAQTPTNDDISSIDTSPSSSTTVVMITQDMKRVLIEELGYRRKDVNVMRVEMAGPIIEKRVTCPPEGMPDAWVDSSRLMLERLENESKHPLKVPLLAVSLVLAGKGLSDAIVTLIKVNMDFPGASLMEEFMGINVLAIDAVCVAAGVALGVWTWQTMRDGDS